MKIEIDVDLLLEAIAGLRCYGQKATADTANRLSSIILDAAELPPSGEEEQIWMNPATWPDDGPD
jgi:hypothetical protein